MYRGTVAIKCVTLGSEFMNDAGGYCNSGCPKIPREGSLVVVEPRHSSDRSHQDSGGHFQGSRQGRGSVWVVVVWLGGGGSVL